MAVYEFSSINLNTNKRKCFTVKAKSLQGAWSKARLITVGHTELRLEEGFWPEVKSDSLAGQPVPHLSNMLKF